jgi:hypothetical protein
MSNKSMTEISGSNIGVHDNSLLGYYAMVAGKELCLRGA